MQEAALEAAGVFGTYKALETPAPFLRARLQEVRREYRGINVTIPHKQAVIPLLDEVSLEAQAIGAVNTILNENGRLIGFNTDAAGFMSGLDEAAISYIHKKALILGAGGAARAIAFALKQAGAQVAIYNRTPEKAQELAQAFQLTALTPILLEPAVRTCDLLINTSSVGLKDPHTSPLPEGLMPLHGTVIDIVYNPLQTKLLKEAEALGLKTVGGLPMLVWQGALAFEIWTGAKADIARMYAATKKQLAYG